MSNTNVGWTKCQFLNIFLENQNGCVGAFPCNCTCRKTYQLYGNLPDRWTQTSTSMLVFTGETLESSSSSPFFPWAHPVSPTDQCHPSLAKGLWLSFQISLWRLLLLLPAVLSLITSYFSLFMGISGDLPRSCHFCARVSSPPTPSCWSAPAQAGLAAVCSPHFPTLAPKQNHTVHTASSLSHPCTTLGTLQSILHSFYSIQTEESEKSNTSSECKF